MQGTLESQREHIDSMPGFLVSSEDVGLVDVLPEPREQSKQNMRLWNPLFDSIYAASTTISRFRQENIDLLEEREVHMSGREMFQERT